MLRRNIFISLLVVSLLLFSVTAEAASRKHHKTSYRDKSASLVVHSDSGVVLYEENADEKRYPASLTKLMTTYLAFDALKSRKITFNTQFTVSAHAAQQPRMSLGLRKNERISVGTALDSLVVLSANDAAVVLAEGLGGSEWQFAKMMTQKAKELGMTHTQFRNASGLFHPKQYTTAKDMAKLMMALERDFPQYYDRLGRTKFSYKGRNYRTHNHVLARYKGAVAGKTGYVSASGFNLTTAAKRAGTKLVAVVMGGRTAPSRDRKMISLLDKAFKKAKSGVTKTSFKDNVPTPVTRPQAENETPTPVFRPHAENDAEAIEDNSFVKPIEIASAEATSPKQPSWNVSMGAFKREEEAVAAVASAIDIAPEQLASSQITFASRDKSRGREHWATFHNLSEPAARKACQLLGLVSTPCQISSY